jgi:hypothetical protein
MSFLTKTKTIIRSKPIRIITALCVIAAIMVAVGIGISKLVKSITPKCLHGTYERDGVCYENYCKQDCKIDGEMRDWSKPPNCPCKCPSGQFSSDGACKPLCGDTKEVCKDNEECTYYNIINDDHLSCIKNTNPRICFSGEENNGHPVACGPYTTCSSSEEGPVCIFIPDGSVSECENGDLNYCMEDLDCYGLETCSGYKRLINKPGICSGKAYSNDNGKYVCCPNGKGSIDQGYLGDIIVCCSSDEEPINYENNEYNQTGCCPSKKVCSTSEGNICLGDDDSCTSSGKCSSNKVYDINEKVKGCCPDKGKVYGTSPNRKCGIISKYPGESEPDKCSSSSDCGTPHSGSTPFCDNGNCKLICGSIVEHSGGVDTISGLVINDDGKKKSFCYDESNTCSWGIPILNPSAAKVEPPGYDTYICNADTDTPDNDKYWKPGIFASYSASIETDADKKGGKIDEKCTAMSCAKHLDFKGVYDIEYSKSENSLNYNSYNSKISTSINDGGKCIANIDCNALIQPSKSSVNKNKELFSDFDSENVYWPDTKLDTKYIAAEWDSSNNKYTCDSDGDDDCRKCANNGIQSINACKFLSNGEYCSNGSLDGQYCLTTSQSEKIAGVCDESITLPNGVGCYMPYSDYNKDNNKSKYYCTANGNVDGYNTCCGKGYLNQSTAECDCVAAYERNDSGICVPKMAIATKSTYINEYECEREGVTNNLWNEAYNKNCESQNDPLEIFQPSSDWNGVLTCDGGGINTILILRYVGNIDGPSTSSNQYLNLINMKYGIIMTPLGLVNGDMQLNFYHRTAKDTGWISNRLDADPNPTDPNPWQCADTGTSGNNFSCLAYYVPAILSPIILSISGNITGHRKILYYDNNRAKQRNNGYIYEKHMYKSDDSFAALSIIKSYNNPEKNYYNIHAQHYSIDVDQGGPSKVTINTQRGNSIMSYEKDIDGTLPYFGASYCTYNGCKMGPDCSQKSNPCDGGSKNCPLNFADFEIELCLSCSDDPHYNNPDDSIVNNNEYCKLYNITSVRQLFIHQFVKQDDNINSGNPFTINQLLSIFH